MEGIIKALFSALLLSLGAYLINKMNTNRSKNNLLSKLKNNTISRESLLGAINYYTQEEINTNECKLYIEFAENKYPNDKEINMAIFMHYITTKEYDSAINLLNNLLLKNECDADILYAIGLCYFKKGQNDIATDYKEKAVKIDSSYADRKFL